MDRYIDRKRLGAMKKVLIGCYVLAGVIVLPLIVILIAGIQDGETHAVVTVIILLIIFAAELIAMSLLCRRSLRCLRYAPIFEEDHDGIITFERIHEMTGYGVDRIKGDIEWLLRGETLRNAVIDDKKIILWSETEYIDITCPTCGALNQVRFGSSNKCKHCGSYLRRV